MEGSMRAFGKPTLALAILLALCANAAAVDEEFKHEYDDIRDKLELCFGCHGKNGASEQPNYPILAGQHLHYLYVQMKDFKAGRRENSEMKEPMAGLEKKDMLAMAKFFSEQEWPRTGYRANAEKAGRGETAAAAGQCVQCHRGGYEGDSRIPRLAGQHAEYLKKTMGDFKTKARNNSPAKSTLTASFDDKDIEGLSEFLGGM